MASKLKKVAKTATEALVLLCGEHFFKGAKKIDDVVKKLSGKGYNFPLTNVDKALQRAPYLTQKGKRGSYEYVQRYPFVVGERPTLIQRR